MKSFHPGNFLHKRRKGLSKTLLIMKLTSAFLLAACMQVYATGVKHN
jgi:hypothetical protein